ncbi:type II secretion system inner membrane protein GspF [Sphingosinicella microcystinivorans]|uniref:type II secretion system inner membrane protein GspF n=1 Tax=Sphingosinicella microcystinivorans TaxID=335406 RepID=UPI0022F3835B|nr:type II secretion system inner membrane protein GspF [Sphingosinicella microcystinivorans]WBX82963.1 type II secretion system inner membrane protein GspF [Sphingosinicella microcystinivorans]
MPTFDYLALDTAGRERTGTLTAASESDARALLERRKLLPVRLGAAAETRTAPAPALSAGFGRRKLSSKALTLFTRQLATLISVSPLEESLRSIAMQAEQKKVADVVWRVHGGVVEGRRLADAMALEAASFPPLYRAMVAAGEGSGGMTEILERLADLHERQAEVRGKILTTLAYPAMLALVALLIVIGMMTYVIPKVVEQFNDMGQELPLLTRIVIGISDFMTSYGLIVLALIGVGVLVFTRMMQREDFHLRVDRALLRIPLTGRLLRDLHAARLARTLSTMVENGMPLLDGLAATSRTIRNRVLRGATEDMVESIREGGSLSGSMRRTGIFPPLLVHMTASGESSGKLAPMLGRAADYMEREFDAFTKSALSLLEPLIIVIMGGVIATIVLSILLPILQLDTIAIQ